VGMPVPQVPESLAQGVIDGCVIPWEVVPAVKVHELVNFHTDIPGTPTLYTSTFVLAMNKARYDAMSDELRQIMDAQSGMEAARMAGAAWDAASADARAQVEQRGNVITTLTEEETQRWRERTAPVVERWVEEMKGRGIEPERLLDKARALIGRYDQA
jgi:TRAP-type transport system periplasmic protein